MTTPSKPLLCRTNLRHTWEWAHTRMGTASSAAASATRRRATARAGAS